MNDASPIAVGLIGAGNFARSLHLPNLARMRECRLHAICDLRQEVLHDLAGRYRPAYVTTDHQRLLADPAIAAVVIAVRDDLQAPMAIAALHAGKHVYVEKPLAETPELCAQVVAAQRGAVRLLAVGFNRRFAPAYQRARALIAAHGGAFNIAIRMADDAWRWAKGYPPGFLIKLDLCHHFDLLRWLTGSDIASVYCASSRGDDDALVVRLANGCVASLMQSGHGTMDMPKERLEVICRRGGLGVDDFVELRTYGWSDAPAVETFAGHSQPDREHLPKPLFASLGLDGLRAVRRIAWELREQVESGAVDQRPDAAEVRRFVAESIPNFMRDQGWMEALHAFVRAVASGATATGHAGAADALIAAQVADAAVRSRDSGAVVMLGQVEKSRG